MKRWLCLLACLLLFLSITACAQEKRAELADPLEGQMSDGGNVAFSLPQLTAQSPQAEKINSYYRNMAAVLKDDADLQDGENRQISFTLTYEDGQYLCFLLTETTLGGNVESEQISADVFSLDGLYGGERITLSQYLGLEQTDASSTSLAADMAYRLVWQIVEQQAQNPDSDYLDGLTFENIRGAFNPETYFYLDQDGNVVFFIQSGLIAGEIAGVLQYPFAPAELLSAFSSNSIGAQVSRAI